MDGVAKSKAMEVVSPLRNLEKLCLFTERPQKIFRGADKSYD